MSESKNKTNAQSFPAKLTATEEKIIGDNKEIRGIYQDYLVFSQS